MMTTIGKALLETKTMTKRNLWKSVKNPDRLMENIIAPIMTMLIFVFVLGGAMSQTTEVSYVNYIVPGTFLLCIGQCSTASAAGISTDIQKGIVDRFRSMPIANASFLNGHVIESVIRTVFSVLLILIVAFFVGFRPEASLGSWLLAIFLLLLFTVMITWISVVYGLMIKGPDGAGSLTMFIMLFTYLSSGFIPTDTLPKVLRIFAENQPMTAIVEAVRRLLLDQPLEDYYFTAIIWCVGLLGGAILLAIRLFKNKVQ
ncbi:ABC transporter permease [Enterococcus hulanensis]|uniref:ABC transporter permease n=1 Tax=Enterococcus hulanensis TaxID=2559929 RepID=UPI00288EB8C9|nr:ABC transporter permease [Enterococcus hulanensis]MDT2659693.1 ABC transporter permease [Enterococcus hulanensis]